MDQTKLFFYLILDTGLYVNSTIDGSDEVSPPAIK
jgi:hypothetical protein